MNEFNVKEELSTIGASKCSDLSGNLRNLYKEGYLDRDAIGLGGMEAGFPKWIYVYSLTHKGEYWLNYKKTIRILFKNTVKGS